jgi:hypothetical protein
VYVGRKGSSEVSEICDGERVITKNLGIGLAITGSALSLAGALVNNLFLMHTQAMYFWMISNPLLMAYFIGTDKGIWNGQHLSNRSLITITNFYGLWLIW